MRVRISQVSSRARDARAHGRKFLSGRKRAAPVVESFPSIARACRKFLFQNKRLTPVVASICPSVCRARKERPLASRLLVATVGPPSHKRVGDRSKGNVVGAPRRARDRALERVAVGRDALRGGVVLIGTRCPTAAHHGVRGPGWKVTAWEFRRRRGQCSDASIGASRMDVGPLRHRRARLRAIRYRGGSGVAAVLLALSMTYDGRCSSAPLTSSGVERCAAPLTIRRV